MIIPRSVSTKSSCRLRCELRFVLVLFAVFSGSHTQAQHGVTITAGWIDAHLSTELTRSVTLGLSRGASDGVTTSDPLDQAVMPSLPPGPGFMIWSSVDTGPSENVAQRADERELATTSRSLAYRLSIYLGVDAEQVELSWDPIRIAGDPLFVSATLAADDGTMLVADMGQIGSYLYGAGSPGYDPVNPDDLVVTFTVQSALTLSADALLEGPFDAVDMNTALVSQDLLPAIQPYDAAPWEFNSHVELDQLPDNAVDWIMVRLLQGDISSPPLTLKGTAAGIMQSDGRIVFPHGGQTLTVAGVPPGEYYVAVYHRNHLPIISAAPVDFSSGHASADFASDRGFTHFGDNALVEVATGIYALIGGDADADGDVFPSDLINIVIPQLGLHGYLEGDLDMDGDVFPSDLVSVWMVNSGKGSYVPEYQ